MNGEPMTVLGFYGTRGLFAYIVILLHRRDSHRPIVAALSRMAGRGTVLSLRSDPIIGPAMRNMRCCDDMGLGLGHGFGPGLCSGRWDSVCSTQNSDNVSQLDLMLCEIRRGRSCVTFSRPPTAIPPTSSTPWRRRDGRPGQRDDGSVGQPDQETAALAFVLLAIVAGVGALLPVFGLIIFFIFKMFFQIYAALFDAVDSM